VRQFHANLVNILKVAFQFGGFRLNVLARIVGQPHVTSQYFNLVRHKEPPEKDINGTVAPLSNTCHIMM
jgi:hypothetical protein